MRVDSRRQGAREVASRAQTERDAAVAEFKNVNRRGRK
jgi:hypothetical protein